MSVLEDSLVPLLNAPKAANGGPKRRLDHVHGRGTEISRRIMLISTADHLYYPSCSWAFHNSPYSLNLVPEAGVEPARVF